jgi:hypothetical protein
MRTTRLSWLLLLASAIALTGVVAVLAPAVDLQRRAAVAPSTPHRVAPGTFLEIPKAPREHRWPFRDPFLLPDPVRMILY